MTRRTVALAELEQRRVGDVLQEVAEREEELFVNLPGGETILIRPTPGLKPLPKLDCIVPEGWKDAING